MNEEQLEFEKTMLIFSYMRNSNLLSFEEAEKRAIKELNEIYTINSTQSNE